MAAMDWIVQNAPKPAVMSMSLGGKGQSQAYKIAITTAKQNGITVVVASGNSNDDACGYSPAFAPDAITVGATSKTDGRASFSNYGTCLDIYGPGVDILSAGKASDSAWKTMSGTSMACPHVAGAVALLLGKYPKMTPMDVNKALSDGAIKNAVTDAKTGSPNLLLAVFSGKFAGGGAGGGGGPPPPGGGGGGSCKDKATNCRQWSRNCGASYAKRMCMKTCKICKTKGGSGGGGSCKDTATNCDQWKGSCGESYANFMCKKTCSMCGNAGDSRPSRRRSGKASKSARRRRRRSASAKVASVVPRKTDKNGHFKN